ncbi:uncharacterized protein ASPGLDRAFT_146438 [Aspergillus glaucus CBS 516.65]|uniref:Uncharacterized protein n=1 Tax=Aspergillus glaucus CBS 516.65 TaxID=1160497 RepID=A0A1L9VQS8_ASPGL|nr:hypothetical protein ASPGLDRAFT_146438 [Aspergillus glaucus CBS 516.65]OJJ86240.1 hypothetical protein ASPGLDRAFT_146438 [Aspergillus glaucus CBS 516.65]
MTPSTTPSTLSHTLPAKPFESKLSEQLSQSQSGEAGTGNTTDNTRTNTNNQLGGSLLDSPRLHSLPDAPKPVSISQRQSISDEASTVHSASSKDDSSLSSTPATPQRPPLNPQNLALNLPPRPSGSPATAQRAPLSPKLDSSQIYSSRYGPPGSVLPRRSRGLDFSRACTNLHHSTLAESSPESSPTIGARGVAIPQRRGSPSAASAAPFSTSGPVDRTGVSSSVSSVNMIDSDTSTSEEEEDEPMGGDKDDIMLSTPQANKMGTGPSPFAVGNVPSPGNDWMGGYSHAAASLLSFQRARFRKGRSRTRHSSSSASGSSKQSPGPLSPPVMKSIENPNGGYFGGSRHGVQPRRESLSMGTRDLRLSDLSDDGERARSRSPARGEGGPLGVIRRAVTRRGSLLPKTKTFARIRAALIEESSPLDCESKRESEVIRQVRESDPAPQKSPDLLQPTESDRAVSGADDTPSKTATRLGNAFSEESTRGYWNSFDDRYRTPPPPIRPGPPSVSEDDLAMDMTPSTSTFEFAKPFERPSSRGSLRNAAQPTAMQEFKRKRGREDDFDPNLFKRRAVSPSMSAQSSPVMPNSPAMRDTGSNIWGPPPKSNLGSLFPDSNPRNSSSPHTGTLKRVGLQGMTEANDSLMNMSIE